MLTNIEIYDIGIQIINQLEKFHSIGIIHSDIKPDNILLQKPAPEICESKRCANIGQHLFCGYEEGVSLNVSIIDFGKATHFQNKNKEHK